MEAICNNCRHRGTVPNSVHSSCHHPLATEIISNSGLLFSMMKSITGDSELGYTGDLEIELKKGYEGYAIDSGYFIWPINFDPGWIENCNGYKEVE